MHARADILRKAAETMTTAQLELGGKNAYVIPDDADLDLATGTDLALSSGIATTSLRSAEKFRRESGAGMVMVNTPTADLEYHAPLGGRSLSGFEPHETGASFHEFFTESKTSYINHGVI